MHKSMLVSAIISVLITIGLPAAAKECSRLVTAQMRRSAVENARKYAWAAQAQKAAIATADKWVKLTDEQLWKLVPSQELPRDIYSNNFDATRDIGCANCGMGYKQYGRWGFLTDPLNKPWKIICPNCHAEYPKNDFGAFYETALDEHGFFRRELGDRSLLFNAEHPDPNDPLHNVYVDDGYGMVDEQGNKRLPIAYYCQWGLWRNIYRALDQLSWAYALTDDPLYAHKAAVLLDRVADVYPEMDWAPLAAQGFKHSDGSSKMGRIEGRIWECGAIETMARAYDRIYDGIQDDGALLAFISGQAESHALGQKSAIADICRHIEDNFLLEVLAGTRDGRIYGNTGMHQGTVVTAAIALDRPGVTDEWLDWLFDPNYPGDFARKKDSIYWVLTEGLDRDGMGGEVGGYGLIWTRSLIEVATTLARYTPYTNHDIVREFPKLKQAFLIEARINCLDAVMPCIGDSGSTGIWSRAGSAERFCLGYQLYGDPRLASLAWHYAQGDATRLRTPSSIFEQDPEALAAQIAAIAQESPFHIQSDFLGRYGQAVLQTDTTRPEQGRAAWMHYGYGLGHSHRDSLNLGLYAHNIDMLPDFGYPEYCEGRPKQYAWESNTISHNTLLVGDTGLPRSPGGKLTLFSVQPPVRVMDVSSPQSNAAGDTYRRTVALIDVSETNSYVLDIFRARGGTNHRLLYQGPSQTATVEGVNLQRQATGTFAGPDIQLDQLDVDGKRSDFLYNSGFSYLWDVDRSAGPVDSVFTVDWQAEDLRGRIKPGREPHLRLHALTPCDEVALASAQPPPNKPGNPKSLRKLIQTRLGDNVQSQFVTVLEPYDPVPFISSVRPLDAVHLGDENSVAAVAVTLVDGTTDIIISCEEPTPVTVDESIEFTGRFALLRLRHGRPAMVRLAEASVFRFEDIEIIPERAAYTGTVVSTDVSDPHDNRIHLDPPLPPDAPLAGRTIHFGNDLPLDTSFEIARVTPEGISTGDITIINGFKDAADYTAGYTHVVNPGDTYTIPCEVSLDIVR